MHILHSILCLIMLLTTTVSPTPALRELPSITYDTLVGYVEAPGKYKDSSTAESDPVSTTGFTGYTDTAYNLIRNMLRSGEGDNADESTSSPTLSYLTPFRFARSIAGSVASGMAGMGKTFASTFATEFKNSYNRISTEFKERVIPEAANLLGVWTVPPLQDNNWLDGI